MDSQIIARVEMKVKLWEAMGQWEKWLVDPHRAAREDAARARARYGSVGGQRNYSLLANATLYLDTAEYLINERHLHLAAYYLDLAKKCIQMLEARNGFE